MSKTQRDTPIWLAAKMVDLLSYESSLLMNAYFPRLKLLEPSAGEGALIDMAANHIAQKLEITSVELNKDKCELLKNNGFNPIHGDFLTTEFDTKFNLIIAAPPFKNNVDVHHIEKMYSLLEKQGVIVSLTTPYWVINNEEHQVKFREFLKDKKAKFEMLPDNTFTEKGKTVPTMILTLIKY